jgi:hypothetical protein
MKRLAITVAALAATALIGSAALAQRASMSSSTPAFSGQGGGVHAGIGGGRHRGHIRHRERYYAPKPDQFSDSHFVFRRDDVGASQFPGFGFDNRINSDPSGRHRRHRDRGDFGFDDGFGFGDDFYGYGYAYGDGDGVVGYADGEPADFNGFFGNGGQVQRDADGRPIYQYDRSYPFEFSSAGQPRQTRAARSEGYAVRAASCSTELVRSATSTLSVPVRVCRGAAR